MEGREVTRGASCAVIVELQLILRVREAKRDRNQREATNDEQLPFATTRT